jgi:hypothetical protein
VSPCIAAEVFHWVDEDGVVNFSQWAPGHTDGVSRLVTAASHTSDYDPDADPYSILNQAERMQETWDRLAKLKAERKKLRGEAADRAAKLQQSYAYAPYPYDYYSRAVRPPIYRPVHPIYPGHKPRYAKKIQHHQIAAMNRYNRRPNQRVPFSSVTGVSQRASIQSMPGMPRSRF